MNGPFDYGDEWNDHQPLPFWFFAFIWLVMALIVLGAFVYIDLL